jgi:hypothetical protein
MLHSVPLVFGLSYRVRKIYFEVRKIYFEDNWLMGSKGFFLSYFLAFFSG